MTPFEIMRDAAVACSRVYTGRRWIRHLDEDWAEVVGQLGWSRCHAKISLTREGRNLLADWTIVGLADQVVPVYAASGMNEVRLDCGINLGVRRRVASVGAGPLEFVQDIEGASDGSLRSEVAGTSERFFGLMSKQLLIDPEGWMGSLRELIRMEPVWSYTFSDTCPNNVPSVTGLLYEPYASVLFLHALLGFAVVAGEMLDIPEYLARQLVEIGLEHRRLEPPENSVESHGDWEEL